jgi:hypothetical protein
MEVNVQEILFLLGPSSGNLVWTILLYLIFFLSLITMFVMPDKNLIPTLLVGGVLMCTVIAKLSVSTTRNPIFEPAEFGMYIINIVPFVFPFISAGMVRAKKKGTVVPPLILTGLIGGVYFFMFWFLEQRMA